MDDGGDIEARLAEESAGRKDLDRGGGGWSRM